MNLCEILLEGGKSKEFKYVNEETYNWIVTENVKPPKQQISDYAKKCVLPEKEAEMALTSNSSNDKAMMVASKFHFFHHINAIEFIRKNNVKIIKTFQGSLYGI